MTRNAEAALLVGAAAVAAFGVALVNLAQGDGIDAQVALTFVVILASFGGFHIAIRQWSPDASPYLLPLAALLTAVGFVEVYRLNRGLASLQRWWLLIATVMAVSLLLAVRRTGLAPLRRYRYVFLLSGILLLLLPLLPTDWGFPLRGFEQSGSRLWIRFEAGPLRLQFQPGEIAKLILATFLASYLSERQAILAVQTRPLRRYRLPEGRQLAPLVIAWAASFVVLIYQRDLGASLLLFALFIAMLYAATGRAVYLASGGFLFGAGAVTAWLVFAHVQRRVSGWLDPFADFADTGYQIAQSLFAFGSGSLSGSGLGLGAPDQIPNAATDFIFAAVGEELGLAGSVAVIATYALLVAVGFGISLHSRDSFRKLLAGGLSFALGLQTFLIIAGVTRLLPLTGITLPFMSYGGSSLAANFLLLALLARVSHEERV
ncbi:MAG TPA: FtsW/RodA/SpoVE family cell cycle protein [Acidimicrobiia bacterium]|nr:FtsW/RodA/SpoVE family cell cycle protein [Acidimicrobiia bacterium]